MDLQKDLEERAKKIEHDFLMGKSTPEEWELERQQIERLEKTFEELFNAN